MNFEFKKSIPADFHDSSKIWIYQSHRMLLANESAEIKQLLTKFIKQWKSHGAPVKGFATLLFDQFIILMADETATGVGGCSTDSSVHVIKSIEQEYNIRLFDRQLLAFIINENIELIPISQLANAIKNQHINEHTLYFNNTVLTKLELVNHWIIAVKDSWLMKKFVLHKIEM